MEKITVFKKWRTESSLPIEVVLIDFLGYVREHGYIYKFKEGNISYMGEMYKALDSNKNIITVTKRVPIAEDDPDTEEVGWEYNKNPINDGNPYYHQDSEEEILQNRIMYPREKYNPRLVYFMNRCSEFTNKLISLINTTKSKSVKRGLSLYLIFHNTPETVTRNQWRQWEKSNEKDAEKVYKLLDWK